MQNTIVKYGLISGTIVVLIPALTDAVIGHGPETYRTAEVIGYTTIILSMLMIFLAVSDCKRQHSPSVLTAKHIVLLGLGISTIAGFMFGLYNLIYVTYIAPDFMQDYFAYYVENIRNSGLSQAVIEQKVAELEQQQQLFTQPWINFVAMFSTVFMAGVVVSLLAAIFQRNKEPAIADSI